MRRWAAWLLFATVVCAWAEMLAGDADRGRVRFRSLGCIACHSVDGVGGGYAPDLAKRIGRESTPASMAAGLWNRSPFMWRMIRARRLVLPDLEAQDFADLYAYFYSARFFDRAPDASRGRQVFFEKQCGGCHVPGSSAAQPPAPEAFPPLPDAIVLLERMWSACGDMSEHLARKRVRWPELTSQQAADLAAWLSELSARKLLAGELPAASSQPGEKLFQQKGCHGCHSGANAFSGRFSGRTLLDFAVAMWNHAPAMRKRPALDYGEMRQLAAWLWMLQIPETKGDIARGAASFTQKGCTACHQRALTGAPRLTARRWDAFTLMAHLWRQATDMHKKLGESHQSWPVLNASQVADLLAFLNRPPTPRSY
ncbi:MAG: hypothetical protein RMI94_06650 [Bryobacterales bacterium]|nr:hypothetical protein [Bryobacteraceae bacterium]MDW8130211.1 hypothetical protein [Bryobacterales bacterium]